MECLVLAGGVARFGAGEGSLAGELAGAVFGVIEAGEGELWVGC